MLLIGYIIIFSINTYYAINSAGNTQEIEKLYSTTLFGILIFDYNLIDLLRYLYFPILGFGPLIIFILTLLYLKKFSLNYSEFILFCLIVSILLIGIAFVGGPLTTGKNLIRLSNFSYIYLMIIINAFFQETKNNKNIPIICSIFSLFLFFWSLHPTFSKIKIWEFMSYYINF